MPRAWPRWSISCVIYDRVPRWGARTLLHVYISHVGRPLDGWRFVCHQPWPTRGDKSCMRIPWFSQRGQLLSSRVECARMDGRCRVGGESSRIRATVYYRINTNIGPVSQRTCHVLPIRFSDTFANWFVDSLYFCPPISGIKEGWKYVIKGWLGVAREYRLRIYVRR